MKISRLGEAPDYRFSLANERTFLAWIRTALGFLAAGVGLDQLAPDFATPVIRELLALLLCLFSGGLAMYGYGTGVVCRIAAKPDALPTQDCSRSAHHWRGFVPCWATAR